jgi:hypothetical protein
LNAFPLAALAAATLISACAPSVSDTTGGDDARFSGLNAEILDWREAIEATHPICARKVGRHGCRDFDVACKGDLGGAAGAERVVVAMTFASLTTDQGGAPQGSAFAVFTKSGGAWTRAPTAPVSFSTCAPT